MWKLKVITSVLSPCPFGLVLRKMNVLFDGQNWPAQTRVLSWFRATVLDRLSYFQGMSRWGSQKTAAAASTLMPKPLSMMSPSRSRWITKGKVRIFLVGLFLVVFGCVCVGVGGGVHFFLSFFLKLLFLVTLSGRVKLGLGTVPTHLHSVSENSNTVMCYSGRKKAMLCQRHVAPLQISLPVRFLGPLHSASQCAFGDGVRQLLVWQFFSLLAQFKTATKSHESYVFLYPFSNMVISPQNNGGKKEYFIPVNCMGWQVCHASYLITQVFTYIYMYAFVMPSIFQFQSIVSWERFQENNGFEHNRVLLLCLFTLDRCFWLIWSHRFSYNLFCPGICGCLCSIWWW